MSRVSVDEFNEAMAASASPGDRVVSLPMPNPTPAREPRWQSRDLWCERTDRCLSVAERSSWAGLSCLECPLYGQGQAAHDARLEAETRGPGPLAGIPEEPRYQGLKAFDRMLGKILRKRGGVGMAQVINLECQVAAARRGRE